MENRVRITIVIPCREEETAETTLHSLIKQTFQEFRVVVVKDQSRGASWARNEGFKSVNSEFVLFSDNDIHWKPTALERLLAMLDRFPKASYSYGRYKLGGQVWGNQPWYPEMLKHHNYISTMSLIRTEDFPGFDESLTRLQDWDLWLTMLEQGKRGIYCEDLIFETKVRAGITFDENLDMNTTFVDAERIVKRKHGLNEFTRPFPAQ